MKKSPKTLGKTVSKTRKKNISKGKLTFGLALVTIGLILIWGREKINISESNTFASEPVEILGFNALETSESKLPKRIVIPELGVDLEVKKSKLINGFWEVFNDSAGWGEGSGIPGESANQVIFAHAKDGLFKPLRQSKIGMKVYVLTEDRWFLYEVTDLKEVRPSDTQVIESGDDELLTLYTCSGFADSKRLIVIAKPNK